MGVSAGKVAGGAATGAAAGAALGPWGMAGGAVIGGLMGAFSGDGDNAAPAPPPSQYGGNPLTNQLAAQQYAAGLQAQQAQNAREAAFYNQANGNFDIANAAQLRGGPQIATTAEDRARQIAALNGTNSSIGNMNATGGQLSALGNQSSNQTTATGDRLTALGTRPMGDSYAEAQLRQGQDAAMAQQLSMARSGRSLGSGQAAMQQAAFNNSALNQQTNLGAANARIQEQNAYNQFQAGTLGAAGQTYNANNQMQIAALGGAGQQYGSAGALSGQAGNQATGIRQGNENVQLQNAQLQQSQQGINNQTTGLYNQLGAQQQGYGMQANAQGQQAQQFGAQQASGALGAQLNADTGRLSASTATNIANQSNANAHDAATMNMVSSGFGAAADAIGNQTASSGGGTPSANNPSGSTSPYSNITKSSNTAGPVTSDERLKKNIKPLDSSTYSPSSGGASGSTSKPGLMRAPTSNPYAGFNGADAVALRDADRDAALGLGKPGALMDDQDAGKKPVYDEGPQAQPASYAETIAALNAGYRPSQMAPTDVLNHVPGAGAGPSASQAAVIARMQGNAPSTVHPSTQAGAIPAAMAAHDYGIGENVASGGALSAAGHAMIQAPGSPGIQHQGIPLTGATRSPAAPAAPAAWGDVFNQPQLDPRIQAYLDGASPYPTAPAPTAPTFTPPSAGSSGFQGSGHASPDYHFENGILRPNSAQTNGGFQVRSDVHSKTRIRDLEGQLAALQGPPTASFAPQQPDTGALDAAYARQQQAPAVDFRPARAYEYEYKDPHAPGAAPGRQVGPMAQDLLRSPTTAPTVHSSPRGLEVDTPRLTMAMAGAMSEQQRKTQELERQLAAIQSAQDAPATQYPTTRAPY